MPTPTLKRKSDASVEQNPAKSQKPAEIQHAATKVGVSEAVAGTMKRGMGTTLDTQKIKNRVIERASAVKKRSVPSTSAAQDKTPNKLKAVLLRGKEGDDDGSIKKKQTKPLTKAQKKCEEAKATMHARNVNSLLYDVIIIAVTVGAAFLFAAYAPNPVTFVWHKAEDIAGCAIIVNEKGFKEKDYASSIGLDGLRAAAIFVFFFKLSPFLLSMISKAAHLFFKVSPAAKFLRSSVNHVTSNTFVSQFADLLTIATGAAVAALVVFPEADDALIGFIRSLPDRLTTIDDLNDAMENDSSIFSASLFEVISSIKFPGMYTLFSVASEVWAKVAGFTGAITSEVLAMTSPSHFISTVILRAVGLKALSTDLDSPSATYFFSFLDEPLMVCIGGALLLRGDVYFPQLAASCGFILAVTVAGIAVPLTMDLVALWVPVDVLNIIGLPGLVCISMATTNIALMSSNICTNLARQPPPPMGPFSPALWYLSVTTAFYVEYGLKVMGIGSARTLVAPFLVLLIGAVNAINWVRWLIDRMAIVSTCASLGVCYLLASPIVDTFAPIGLSVVMATPFSLGAALFPPSSSADVESTFSFTVGKHSINFGSALVPCEDEFSDNCTPLGNIIILALLCLLMCFGGILASTTTLSWAEGTRPSWQLGSQAYLWPFSMVYLLSFFYALMTLRIFWGAPKFAMASIGVPPQLLTTYVAVPPDTIIYYGFSCGVVLSVAKLITFSDLLSIEACTGMMAAFVGFGLLQHSSGPLTGGQPSPIAKAAWVATGAVPKRLFLVFMVLIQHRFRSREIGCGGMLTKFLKRGVKVSIYAQFVVLFATNALFIILL